MLELILSVALLLVMGLLGLMATGGLPGGSKQAQDAAAEAAAKIAPFAGIIGIVGLVIGVWAFINWITALGLFGYLPVTMIIATLAWVVLIGLGLILAYPLIAKAMAGSGGQESLDKALAAVKPYQRPLSLAAVALAVLYLLIYILARVGVAL